MELMCFTVNANTTKLPLPHRCLLGLNISSAATLKGLKELYTKSTSAKNNLAIIASNKTIVTSGAQGSRFILLSTPQNVHDTQKMPF